MENSDKNENLQNSIPDSSALRVALWRALHLKVDAPPHILTDEIGLKLAQPEASWRARGDMHPEGTRGFRAAIVARSRFIEDLVAEEARRGLEQYVLLGAGLDTFAQRRPKEASTLKVFETDQPGTQVWKRRRLEELGLGVPDWLHLVPIDFEARSSWPEELAKAGFDTKKPTVVTLTGVAMYLTRETIMDLLRKAASFAPGSKLTMTFTLTMDLIDSQDRPGFEMAMKGAQASGTPFISFFTPEEMLAMAREAGFKNVRHVSSAELAQRYFAGREDGLRPSSGEDWLIAST